MVTRTKEYGITLIALIITIIIMLILVGVTVSVALNGGLFTTAKNATNEYTVEKEKELITIGYSNYQMQKYSSINREEDIDLLEKYFLGKDINTLLDDNYKFIDNDTIKDASSSVVLMGEGFNNDTIFTRVLYDGNIYRAILNDNTEITEIEIESTQINLKENTIELESLETYFLSEPNKDFNDFVDENLVFMENDIIPDANTSLIFIGQSVAEDPFWATIQYKNYIYRIVLENPNTCITQKVELESVILNFNTLEVQDAYVEGNEEYGWTITFEGTGHVYTLLSDGTIIEKEGPKEKTDEEKLVEKYFLGEKGEGIDLTDILPNILTNGDMTFANNEIIPDAETNMQMFNDMLNIEYNENYKVIGHKFYVKYKEGIYKVTTIINYEENIIKTSEAKLLYSPRGREGQKITYSYDGTKEHEDEWTILYDNGNNIEIVSPSTMGSLALGVEEDINKTIKSYNEAITEVNKYCREQITNTSKISVRSAGSDPVNPLKENTKLYTSSYLKNTEYDKKAKSPDDNWEQDVIRMLYWGKIKTADEQSYWLASRVTSEWSMQSEYEELGLRAIYGTEGSITNETLWYKGTVKGANVRTNPVRPIVKINQ